jgi:WD40 repeat protein
MNFAFDAFVSAIVDDGGAPVFALGDGTLRWNGQIAREAHQGAVLCAAAHPSGTGVVSGGDDGRLVWSTPDESRLLYESPGRWIDALAVSSDSGLIALAMGKTVVVLDAADPAFRREFAHPASVSGLAFDPRGRRLAAATYGGLALWYARIAEQKPVMLRFAGSHLSAQYSPDGRFLVSALQEPALHGWRVADGKDMAMSGYGARVKGTAFLAGGAWLATGGAPGLVLWPFTGAAGPMGKQAVQFNLPTDDAVTVLLSANTSGHVVAAAAEDGRIALADLRREVRGLVKSDAGPAVSALTLLDNGVLAWGDEDGNGGLVDTGAD